MDPLELLFPYGAETVIRGPGGRSWRETVDRGAFAGKLAGDGEILVLAHHDPGRPLASRTSGTARFSDTPEALVVSVDLPDTSDGRDIAAQHAAGLLGGASPRWHHGAQDVWTGGVRHIRRADLIEISPVALPAYASSEVRDAGGYAPDLDKANPEPSTLDVDGEPVTSEPVEVPSTSSRGFRAELL